MQNSVDYCITKNSRLLNVVPNADAQATPKYGVYTWHSLNTGDLIPPTTFQWIHLPVIDESKTCTG